MPQFILTINLGNDGMQTGNDLAKVLVMVEKRINSNYEPYPVKRELMDIAGYGNTVGHYEVV